MVPKIPRAQEVILRARAIDRRMLFAVNKEHVVAFAPPTVLILENGHGHTHEVPLPGRFKPYVITLSVEILPGDTVGVSFDSQSLVHPLAGIA